MDKLAEQFQKDVATRYQQKMAEAYDFIKDAGHHSGLTRKDYKFLQQFLKAYPEHNVSNVPEGRNKYKEIIKNIRDQGGLWFHTLPMDKTREMTINTNEIKPRGTPKNEINPRKLLVKSPLGVLGEGNSVSAELPNDANHPVTGLPLWFDRVTISPEGIKFSDGTFVPHSKPILPKNYRSENGRTTFNMKDAPIPFEGNNIDNIFSVGTFSGTDRTEGVPIGDRTQPPLDAHSLVKTPYTISTTRIPDDTYGSVTAVIPQKNIRGQNPKAWKDSIELPIDEYRIFPSIDAEMNISTPTAEGMAAYPVESKLKRMKGDIMRSMQFVKRMFPELVPIHESTANKINGIKIPPKSQRMVEINE